MEIEPIRYDLSPGFPVYSPSQTGVYLDCPMAWYLRYGGKWQSKRYDHREIAGSVGAAFSVYQEYLPHGQQSAKEIAHETLEHNLRRLSSTRTVADRATSYLDDSHERLTKFIHTFETHPVIPNGWTLFDREAEFTGFGRCRIDAMYKTSYGSIGVLDYKTRGRLQANQREKAKREFMVSDQLYHYAWASSLIYGEPVELTSICIVVLEPKPWIDLWQFKIKAQTLLYWVESRKQVWQDMRDCYDGKRVPYMVAEHENKYGKCQFYEICYGAQFDEGSIRADWMKKD